MVLEPLRITDTTRTKSVIIASSSYDFSVIRILANDGLELVLISNTTDVFQSKSSQEVKFVDIPS